MRMTVIVLVGKQISTPLLQLLSWILCPKNVTQSVYRTSLGSLVRVRINYGIFYRGNDPRWTRAWWARPPECMGSQADGAVFLDSRLNKSTIVVM